METSISERDIGWKEGPHPRYYVHNPIALCISFRTFRRLLSLCLACYINPLSCFVAQFLCLSSLASVFLYFPQFFVSVPLIFFRISYITPFPISVLGYSSPLRYVLLYALECTGIMDVIIVVLNFDRNNKHHLELF